MSLFKPKAENIKEKIIEYAKEIAICFAQGFSVLPKKIEL